MAVSDWTGVLMPKNPRGAVLLLLPLVIQPGCAREQYTPKSDYLEYAICALRYMNDLEPTERPEKRYGL